MNAHDLLKAFQDVDSEFLEEAAAREHIAPKKTVRQLAASLFEKKEEVNPGEHTVWQGVMGAAAVVAVFSIIAAGFVAVRPDSGMVATQPADSAVTDMSGSNDITETTTLTESGSTSETTTETTGLQLPSDEFVEETLPPKAEEPQLNIDWDYVSAVLGMGCDIRKVDGAPNDYEAIELGAVGEKLHLELSVFCQYEELNPWGSVDMRIVLMQNGELIPFALHEDDEFALWQDMKVNISRTHLIQDVWLVPNHEKEYSQLNAIVWFDPIWGTSQPIYLQGHGYSAVTLHTAEPVQADSDELPYAVAAAEDYIDYPEVLLNSMSVNSDGLAIGSKLDYSANVENRYTIRAGDSHHGPFGRDELYLKLHRSTELIREMYTPEGLEDFNYAMTGAYVVVFCDGVPIPAFDGKYVLAMDVPTMAKTLNYNLTLDDSVTAGEHVFSAIAVGTWDQPLDAYAELYFTDSRRTIELE